MDIIQIPVLADNYNYLLHDSDTGETACIDPSLAEPVLAAIEERGWTLDRIYNTHHHWDHTDGNAGLKEATGCTIYGFQGDAGRIPAIDVELQEGDHILVGKWWGEVMLLTGHTHGHVGFYFPEKKALFSGDVLFGCGCGRLFEGSPEDMHQSLQKIAALPDDTLVYCGHEYTEKNIRFALTLEAGNIALLQREADTAKYRRQHKPTIPTTIALEKATNPFLRCDSKPIRRSLSLGLDIPDTEVLAAIRKKRDRF